MLRPKISFSHIRNGQVLLYFEFPCIYHDTIFYYFFIVVYTKINSMTSKNLLFLSRFCIMINFVLSDCMVTIIGKTYYQWEVKLLSINLDGHDCLIYSPCCNDYLKIFNSKNFFKNQF